MVSHQNKTAPRWRNLIRKIWRPVRGLLLTISLVLLVVLVVLALPVTRSGLLKVALNQGHRFLPGEMSVEHVSWSGFGRLELQGLVWRVGVADSLEGAAVGDTLAQVDHFILDVDLEDLRARDLLVKQISLMAGPVDVPAIIKLFPASSDSVSVATADTSSTRIPFLREGDWPLVPSLAIQNFEMKIRDTRLDDSLYLVAAGLEISLEMRADHGVSAALGKGRVRIEMQQDEPLFLNADHLELSFSADCRKREFTLDHLSVRLPEAGTPAIREAWLSSDPVTLQVSGKGSWTDTGVNVTLDGSGLLPGPEHMRPLLPSEFPEEITGPLVGTFVVDASVPNLSVPDPTATVRLDFSETQWLESLQLIAAVEAGLVSVDTLNVALMGVHLAASGSGDTKAVDAQVAMGMEEPTLLHFLGGPALADADASLDLQLKLKGFWPVPNVDMDLVASARTNDLEVPSLKGRIRTRDRLADVVLTLDQGLDAGTVAVDSIKLNWSGDLSRPDSLTHRFDLGVWAPLGRVALGGTGTVDSLRTVILDSLVVVSLDSTMSISMPATITHGPGDRDLRIENFQLAGGLGTIALDCSMDHSGLTLQMETDLLLKEEFLMEVAPNEIWSGGGGADLSIQAAVELENDEGGPVFNGSAGAMILPHRDDPEMGVDLDFFLVQGDSSGLGADLVLRADEATLLTGQFRWPGHPDLETGKWVPDMTQGLHVNFPKQEFDLSKLDPVMPPDVALSGLLNFGGLLKEQLGTDETAEAKTILTSVEEASISAHLGVSKLEVELPNRSRIALRIDTNLEGSVSAPVIRGEIEILSGYFRIPEMPRALLPTEGESLLWQAMAQDAGADHDSLSIPVLIPDESQGPVLGTSKTVFIPDLDVKLEMPGNLVVNGFGLNVELEGNLHATRGQDLEGVDMVVLKGHAGVKQGTLKFMNNVFDIEKADIRFNRAAPPNPHLDVQLVADVSSYLIYLKITGFSDDPVIELSSEPDMNEADIIAVLLFGQPANDLDNDQRGRAQEENDPGAQLRENLAAMAVVFGGAGIQNKMSNTLGVDMVEMGADSEGASTIMVGKFITPRVLLKYNQSLEKSGTYFMTMEYRLSQYFQLLSTYGQGEEASGLELKWIRRY